MSRADQTQTAVLGALSVMPMTGYALREEIRSVLGHFWSESFGQIYPALAELEEQDLIERRSGGSSRSTIFAITPAGTVRLRELLSTPAQPARPRNGLLLRLFFGRQLGPEACRRLVLDARDQAQAQLAVLAAARREAQETGTHPEDSAYWLLTISAGEHAARAAISWAEESLEALAGFPARPPGMKQPVNEATSQGAPVSAFVILSRLRRAATPRRTAAAAAAGLSLIAAFQAALALGAPWGQAAFGGATSGQLPSGLRVVSFFSMAIWVLAALTVLARGRSEPGPPALPVRWGVRGFAVLLGVGALMNAASASPWERFFWAPLALVLMVLCLRLDRRREDAAPVPAA